jgi:ABC-type antimicrobial peptide transport system permease subunit
VLGQQFKLPNMQPQPPYQPAAETSQGWMQVIGIVADSRNDGLRNPAKPALYIPYGAKMRMFTQILVRTKVPPLSILQDVRRELVRIDREQQVMRVRDLEGWITGLQEYSQQRLIAGLFGVFSALALVLAGIGIYSVVSYGVATRTNEFGIRIALGAQAPDVMRIALSATLRHIAAGLLLGVVAAVAFHRAAVAWWPATKLDPVVLAGVGLVMATMAIVACLLPASRAAAVDPMAALRAE